MEAKILPLNRVPEVEEEKDEGHTILKPESTSDISVDEWREQVSYLKAIGA